MPVVPSWSDFDDTGDYRADASALVRWEAMHAVVSTYSNRDSNAYGRASDYTQEISPLLEFFEARGDWVKQRFGVPVWNQMMDFATTLADRAAKLETFFRDVPEDLAIHDLRAADFQHIRNRPDQPPTDECGNWLGESVFANGLWFLAASESGFEVRDAQNNLVERLELPEEI